MALGPRLELRQGQSLVMTPQLQQAIKLLQMSSIELQSFVDAELERNPLLERDERLESRKNEAPAEAPVSDMVADVAGHGDAAGLADYEAEQSSQASGTSRADTPGSADSGWSSFRPSGAVSLDNDEGGFAANLSRQKSLTEHLTEQLSVSLHDPVDRMIGQYMIGMVNEQGYLSAELAAVADTLGADFGRVQRVLAVLQTFDPPGVFARDLKECLRLQLVEANRFDPAMAALLDNLELVARRDYARLKTACKVDGDELQEMVAELRRLNPKPGHAFGSELVQTVIPDVIVRAAPDGSWIVELNSDTLPRVLLNNQYMARVAKTAQREQDKLYLSECHANATWLLKSLDQRAKTILKVAREIVRQQDAFLVLGVQHLRPLNLKTVADAIEMHESTVSRVTSNKYMATPRGVYELKYFFTTAIASSETDGDAHSSEAVRHRIKELIEAEGESILSDDAIVERLNAAGIGIARRTVAKYRESLGISSSVLRRRERKIGPASRR